MTNAARKASLEATMSKIVGKPVDLTIRGAKSFTFSTEVVDPALGDVIAAYFGKLAVVTVEHDDECGSFAYVEAA